MTELTSSELKSVFPTETDHRKTHRLISEVSNPHPVIAETLIKHGPDSFGIVKSFFKVDLNCIDNYGEMKDCDKASDRLLHGAINE